MAELAAIGTVGSIAAMGAKLASTLYNFSSTMTGAKTEITSVAESISVFCTVLKLLGSTLEKQKSARFSISALSTVYDILGHCRKQFDKISVIVSKLQKERDGTVNFDVMARAKWLFKRGEVMRMQKDLDSMKLTLGIMLQALEFQRKSVDQKCSEAERAIELEETQCIGESLIAAQLANDEEVSLLGDESENGSLISSFEIDELSWRISTYRSYSTDDSMVCSPRKQFINLVQMWAETGELPPTVESRGGSGPSRRLRNGSTALSKISEATATLVNMPASQEGPSLHLVNKAKLPLLEEGRGDLMKGTLELGSQVYSDPTSFEKLNNRKVTHSSGGQEQPRHQPNFDMAHRNSPPIARRACLRREGKWTEDTHLWGVLGTRKEEIQLKNSWPAARCPPPISPVSSIYGDGESEYGEGDYDDLYSTGDEEEQAINGHRLPGWKQWTESSTDKVVSTLGQQMMPTSFQGASPEIQLSRPRVERDVSSDMSWLNLGHTMSRPNIETNGGVSRTSR